MSSVTTDPGRRPEENTALLDDLLVLMRIVRDHDDLAPLTHGEIVRLRAKRETIASVAKVQRCEVYRTNAGDGFVNESVIVIDSAIRVILHGTFPGTVETAAHQETVAAAEKADVEDAEQDRIAAINDLYADARRGDLL